MGLTVTTLACLGPLDLLSERFGDRPKCSPVTRPRCPKRESSMRRQPSALISSARG
jgi:hypothetical protein